MLASFEAWFVGAGRGSLWSFWSAPDLRTGEGDNHFSLLTIVDNLVMVEVMSREG